MTKLPIVAALLLCVTHATAQDAQSIKIARVQTSQSIELRHSNPMFVISAENRVLLIAPATETRHSFSLDLPEIKDQWIESIAVIDGQDAIEKYGEQGRYGVIVIGLKEGTFEKMPPHLAERFKTK